MGFVDQRPAKYDKHAMMDMTYRQVRMRNLIGQCKQIYNKWKSWGKHSHASTDTPDFASELTQKIKDMQADIATRIGQEAPEDTHAQYTSEHLNDIIKHNEKQISNDAKEERTAARDDLKRKVTNNKKGFAELCKLVKGFQTTQSIKVHYML